MHDTRPSVSIQSLITSEQNLSDTQPPSADQCLFTNSPLDGKCVQINVQQASQLRCAMAVVFASGCNRQSAPA